MQYLRDRYDEAAAPRAVPTWHEPFCLSPSSGTCFYCGAQEDPAKVKYVPQPTAVLADIEAKRQLLNRYAEVADNDVNDLEYAHGYANALGEAVRLLAQQYAMRPDYKEDWRP